MWRTAAALIATIGAVAGAAAQEVILLDTQRNLDADLALRSEFGICSGEREAIDTHSIEEPGFWHQVLDAEIDHPDGPTWSIQAHGVQYSTITETGVSFYGYLDYETHYYCNDYWWSDARLCSSSRTRLLVAAPTTVILSGVYTAELRSWNAAIASLYASADIVIDQLAGSMILETHIPLALQDDGATEASLEQPLAAVVELLPGIYDVHLAVSIDVPGWGVYDQWEHSAELTHVIDLEFLPHAVEPECEYVDTDNDGDIDLRDFYFFQQCFTGPGL